ncbi:MAG: D-glycero-alpha-D-manno-heptose-1,7-bisphosphate 7-phosphatase [Chloroflexota bacterium]
MKARTRAAAVFLDRDGTLVRDVGYLRCVAQLEVLAGVPQALVLLRDFGFKLVVVTNQSAVARGWLSEEELGRIHDTLAAELARGGARLDRIYYCPHHPTEGNGPYRIECACRKPKTGMIERACAELGVDPALSYVVGDQGSDMEMARRVGAIAVRITTENKPGCETGLAQSATAVNLTAAARWIVGHASGKAEGARAQS